MKTISEYRVVRDVRLSGIDVVGFVKAGRRIGPLVWNGHRNWMNINLKLSNYMGKMSRICRLMSIAFALILNLIATILAIFGLLNPIEGAFVHNIGSVIVIIYASSLLKYK